MAEASEVVPNAASANPMLLALSKIAPAKFQAPAAIAAIAEQPKEAAEVEQPTAVEEPAAEVKQEQVVEQETPAAAIEAKPVDDPRIADLTQRLTDATEQLKGYRTAEQKAADTAELADIKAAVVEVKEAYGEDSPIGKVLDKITAALDKVSSKAEAAQEVTVARDADTAHRNARVDIPVMTGIYAALDKNSKDPAANRHLQMAAVIDREIMAEKGLEQISWKDAAALQAYYKEVERRLTEDNPNLLAKYAPKAAPVAKPAAKNPEIKPAAVKGPTTMSGIKGGQTLAPAKPVELGKMNFKQQVDYAGRPEPKRISATATRH